MTVANSCGLCKNVRIKDMFFWLTIFPYVANEWVLAGLQVLHNVLVQRVHVLHQPLRRRIVDLQKVND